MYMFTKQSPTLNTRTNKQERDMEPFLPDTTSALSPAWLNDSSSPAYHFWSCLVQPLYEPITNRALPAPLTLPLVCLLLLLLTWLGTTTSDTPESSARRHKRRARVKVKSRRRALWARLRASLPAYSILFAYVATGKKQTNARACFGCKSSTGNHSTHPHNPTSHVADGRRVRLPAPTGQDLGGRLV